MGRLRRFWKDEGSLEIRENADKPLRMTYPPITYVGEAKHHLSYVDTRLRLRRQHTALSDLQGLDSRPCRSDSASLRISIPTLFLSNVFCDSYN